MTASGNRRPLRSKQAGLMEAAADVVSGLIHSSAVQSF